MTCQLKCLLNIKKIPLISMTTSSCTTFPPVAILPCLLSPQDPTWSPSSGSPGKGSSYHIPHPQHCFPLQCYPNVKVQADRRHPIPQCQKEHKVQDKPNHDEASQGSHIPNPNTWYKLPTPTRNNLRTFWATLWLSLLLHIIIPRILCFPSPLLYKLWSD